MTGVPEQSYYIKETTTPLDLIQWYLGSSASTYYLRTDSKIDLDSSQAISSQVELKKSPLSLEGIIIILMHLIL